MTLLVTAKDNGKSRQETSAPNSSSCRKYISMIQESCRRNWEMAEKKDRGDGMKPGNIFSKITDLVKDEIFETLLKTDHLELERIISSGQATPPGQWYEQQTDEWVILLKGRAGLLFEGKEEMIVLHPGDYVHILAHQRHRVEWTDGEQKTVWLALHYLGSDG